MRQLAVHFGTGRVRHLERGLEATPSLGQIVKDRRYLVDNVSCSRLSDLKRVVNHKARGGLGGRATTLAKVGLGSSNRDLAHFIGIANGGKRWKFREGKITDNQVSE
jgi:hypothetical protein